MSQIYTAKLTDKVLRFTSEGNVADFDGQKVEFKYQSLSGNGDGLYIYTSDNAYRVYPIAIDTKTKTVTLLINNETYEVQIQNELDVLLSKMGLDIQAGAGLDTLIAPMPGKVIDVLVEEGQEVEEGTPLVILEAMKMENVLKAEAPVKIKEIPIKKGDAVEKNASLILFD